jgi:hypothetical protein
MARRSTDVAPLQLRLVLRIDDGANELSVDGWPGDAATGVKKDSAGKGET